MSSNLKNTANTSGEDKDPKDKKKRNCIIAAAVIIILILLLLLLRSCGAGEKLPQVFDLAPDENLTEVQEPRSKEEIEAELNQKAEDGMMTISMNPKPTFATGTSEGDLLITNDEANHYPQVVEIYRDDTEELLYQSGGIPVGKEVKTGKLLVDLEPGSYACTAYFNAVDEDTSESVGKAGVNITITVQG